MRHLVFFLGIIFATVVSAQESINHASVSGRVTDPSGAIVEGARITARQTDTNLTTAVTTDREGRFRFPYLKVGPYEIKAHREGFADLARLLTLTIGSAFELPFSLAVESRQTSVDVSGEAMAVLVYEWRSLSEEGQAQVLALRDIYEAIWLQVLGEAKDAGFIRGDVFITRRFLTGALSWTTTWFRADGSMSLDQLADEALILVLEERQ
jgi:Protocatechuate 3,4-dioxygenase beta subunit